MILIISLVLDLQVLLIFFFGVSEVRRVSNSGGQLRWQRGSGTLPCTTCDGKQDEEAEYQQSKIHNARKMATYLLAQDAQATVFLI